MTKNNIQKTIVLFYNKNKSFFIKLLIFILIVFSLDYSIGSILNYYFFKQESGIEYRSTYSIEKTKAEILIFGASRANHHYFPGAFENKLHMSCYNVGRDGTSIFYHFAVLKAILKRYSPKIIILDFGVDYEKNQTSYDRISVLLPYYKKHPEIDSIVNLKSPLEKFKLLSKIYPFNSSIFAIIAGNSEFNKQRYKELDGYVPLSGIWNEPIKLGNHLINYKLDSTKVKIYESFIKECIASNIRLYVVISPYFIKYNFIHPDIQMGEQIAQKYNIKFFNYSQDSTFINNYKFFQDPIHINDEGAKLFSNIIINEILRDKVKH